MTPIRLAQSLAQSLAQTAVHTAVDTVRHPVAGASRAVGLARGVIEVARAAPGIVADTVATRTQGGPPTDAPAPDRASERETGSPETSSGAGTSTPAADSPAPGLRPLKTTVPDPADPTAPPAPGQGGVPDLAPPDPADRVLVVEEALAAEASGTTADSRFGVATEPHASTRGEDHGERPLARAEVDELAEESESRE